MNAGEKLFPSQRPSKLESHTHTHTHTCPASHLKRRRHEIFVMMWNIFSFSWADNAATVAAPKGQHGRVRAHKGSAEWKLGYMWSTKILIRLKWIPSACCLTRGEEKKWKELQTQGKRGRTIGQCLLVQEQRKSLFQKLKSLSQMSLDKEGLCETRRRRHAVCVFKSMCPCHGCPVASSR